MNNKDQNYIVAKWLFLTIILIVNSVGKSIGQQNDFIVKGFIRSNLDSTAIVGASVTVDGKKKSSRSDQQGYFSIKLDEGMDRLHISHVQYKTVAFQLTGQGHIVDIYMTPSESAIDEVEVVQTGYFAPPKERATGSYSYIDQKMLNRAVGEDILSRLDNLVPGLQFKKPDGINASDIRVRGLSTIHSDETPLIVLDNFPYDGDLKNINPSDIESVTVLKDAAASSIWGARAGNGVIVIQTKKGKFDSPISLNLSMNRSLQEKPNFMASHNRIPSSILLSIEKEKYEKGAYVFNNNTPIPAYVELLDLLARGQISQAEFDLKKELYANTEIRSEAMKYLYRINDLQQYAFSANGGGKLYRFNIGLGLNNTKSQLVGAGSNNVSLNASNTFRVGQTFSLSAALRYNNRKSENNGVSYNSLVVSNLVNNQYMPLKDVDGVNQSISSRYPFTYLRSVDGLLDWEYRPLDEYGMVNNISSENEVLAQVSLDQKIFDGLALSINYQYAEGGSSSTTSYEQDSYYVRNLVNRYTQADGKRVIPYGGIFIGNPTSKNTSESFRGQLNLTNYSFRSHEVNALIGAEVRMFNNELTPGFQLYNYDTDLLVGNGVLDYNTLYNTKPSGRARIPFLNPRHSLLKDNFISYYGNLGYHFRDKYLVSGSVRWDASNLFGVKANQKGTVLWSIGTGWNIDQESFYNGQLFDKLKLRLTYGHSGNVNKSISHHPIVKIDVNPLSILLLLVD